MKYRQRRVEVEAKQWWPPGDNRHDPSMLVRRKGGSVDPPDYEQVGDLYDCSGIFGNGIFNGVNELYFFIKTETEHRRVMPGDWIVTDIDGKVSAERMDDFLCRYEAVEENES